MIGVYNYTVIITYLSIVSACVGMNFSMNGNIKMAIFCLMFSGLCDMLDGPVARTRKNRTETEVKFGVQIDSLSDVIAFGVQPAVLLYCAIAHEFPNGSYLVNIASVVGICLLLCAVIRLAFFNVSEEERQKVEGNKRRTGYRGLPVTNVAYAVPIGFLFRYSGSSAVFSWGMIGMCALTAFLFVYDFPMVKIHGRKLIILFLIGVAIFTGVVLA